jgi:hypothetical protein
MAPPSKGFLDAAYQVLKEAGRPMHSREIVQECLARGLWTTDAEDPELSGTTTLYSAARRRPNARGFTMLGRGMFGLSEWNGETTDSAESDAVASTTPEPANSDLEQPVSFTVAGRQFILTGRQALDIARNAIAAGLPPESQSYLSWAVQVDGQLIGVKWLFSLITGIPRYRFVTSEAAPVLRRLGLSAQQVEAGKTQQVTPGAHQARVENEASFRPTQRVQTPSGAHAVLDAQIAAVRDFLNGRGTRPSDERLCDWVNFCYEFGLYREGNSLFRLIDPSQVNNWYYERTKRLARVCALKAAGQA